MYLASFRHGFAIRQIKPRKEPVSLSRRDTAAYHLIEPSTAAAAESLSRQKLESRRGNPFSRMTINNILNNKAQVGRIVHNGIATNGLHIPIVFTRLRNRCNQMLSG